MSSTDLLSMDLPSQDIQDIREIQQVHDVVKWYLKAHGFTDGWNTTFDLTRSLPSDLHNEVNKYIFFRDPRDHSRTYSPPHVTRRLVSHGPRRNRLGLEQPQIPPLARHELNEALHQVSQHTKRPSRSPTRSHPHPTPRLRNLNRPFLPPWARPTVATLTLDFYNNATSLMHTLVQGFKPL
ncbi:hypothetical protein GQ43DRAFT_475499 [Delitschia confertaspora ATCC 74209]|uniref:Uncharacterized protein n=1 Tax=Delitschia confertaspora ATCC 74209 TaxID=1513339 RepID=A0A9P4JJ08_9PLEO|nr:hypothetical protein GQ43DRAFT_475499 [Delitschia confertaspora ATCC 74209]